MLDAIDTKALRDCALLCWQRREEMNLSPAQIEQVLIAWMAVGTPTEGETASEILRVRREAERMQANFDRQLKA